MNTQIAVDLITNPSPLLLEEIVLSPDSLDDIAARHNLDADMLKAAYTHPVFVSKIAAAKSHHEKTGEFDRALTRHKYQEALDNAHFKAMDDRTSPKDAIAWVETLANIGGIKNSAVVDTSTAGRFVFNINFSNKDSVTIGAGNAVGAEKVVTGEIIDTSDELPVVSLARPEEFEFTD